MGAAVVGVAACHTARFHSCVEASVLLSLCVVALVVLKKLIGTSVFIQEFLLVCSHR